MGNQENKEGAGQGFDGLSSMVSDVDSIVENARKSAHSAPAPPSTPIPQPSPSTPREPSRGGAIYLTPTQPSGVAPVIKWILIIGGVLFLGSLIMSGSGNKKSNASTSASGPSRSTPTGSTNTYTQSERFTEAMPSVGTNNVLNSAEIRYCIAESIRIDGANSAVDNYDQGSVDRFNRMVNNYNSRCGQYRYRSGALESAKSAVEPYRSSLMAEGRRRI